MSRWEPDAEGRLIKAAITLFEQRGYDETTVAEIADAAGLTKRTFFRHFTDKREVLFRGSNELQECWLAAVTAAPPDAGPMAAVSAGLEQVARLFVDRLAFARMRSGIITAHPELQERELIKLQVLTDAIQRALVDRGVAVTAAVLAAHTGVTVFHVAFARWVQQDDPAAMRDLMDESLSELRAVICQP
jgi:AcrR family transcriptional regulator